MDKYVIDGDLGCGTPGSTQWHLCMIAQLDNSEVPGYMLGAFGVSLEGEDIKEQATRYIHEHDTGSS